MKLRIISEVITADENMVFNYLGNAANNLFGGDKDKLPKRYRRYKKEQVEYSRAKQHNVRCSTCKFFDEQNNTCVMVEGRLHPDAVCKMWDQGVGEEPTPDTPSTETTS